MSDKLPNLSPAQLAALNEQQTYNRLVAKLTAQGVSDPNTQAAEMLEVLIDAELAAKGESK